MSLFDINKEKHKEKHRRQLFCYLWTDKKEQHFIVFYKKQLSSGFKFSLAIYEKAFGLDQQIFGTGLCCGLFQILWTKVEFNVTNKTRD